MTRQNNPCPYDSGHCDGQGPGGDMMCLRCYDSVTVKEFEVSYVTAEEAEIIEKENNETIPAPRKGGRRT